MGPMRRLPSLVLSLFTVVSSVAVARVTLSDADQRCFFLTVPAETTTPLRSCRTCLNENLSAAPCFLNAQGLCLSMDSYNVSGSGDGFVAAYTTYCESTDEICAACLEADPTSTTCTGREGTCVCLAVCESATWEADAKAAVAVASSGVSSPSTHTDESSHTPLAVTLLGVIACVVVAGLIAATIRRRLRKKPAPTDFTYKMMRTPTADLQPKTLSGRV